MKTTACEGPMEELFENEQWTRRLARSLLRDADDADDVVQAAHVALWRQGPTDPSRTRAWLGTVVRNLVRNRARDDGRRRAKLAAEGPDVAFAPSPEELLERLETHRRLAELVAGLEEPYRRTILLRYYEDLSSAEIARRLGLPAGTIRWRLKAGLDELRRRLDASSGERGKWMAVLLPWSRSASDAQRRPAPRWIAASVVLGFAGVALVLAGLAAKRPAAGRIAQAGGASANEVRAPIRDGNGLRPIPRFSASAYGPRVHPAIPRWAAVSGVAPRTIHGVVTAGGRPVAAVDVRLTSGMVPFAKFDQHAVTDEKGRYAFAPQPPTNFLLSVAATDLRPESVYVDLRGQPLVGDDPHSVCVDVALVACSERVHGSVLTADGSPLSAAEVNVGTLFGRTGWPATVDDSGHFEACVPGWRGNPAPRTAPHAALVTPSARSS